jgi:hypothetical protein
MSRPSEEQVDRKLDLMVRLPHTFELVKHPEAGILYAIGPDVLDLLLDATRQTYLVLPWESTPLKEGLRNTWLANCWDAALPTVTVEINPNWGGQIVYDFRPMQTQMPPAVFTVFQAELAGYFKELGNRRPQLKNSRKPCLVAATHGGIAFPAGEYDVVQLVVGYAEEVRNRKWVFDAPYNPGPEDPERPDV